MLCRKEIQQITKVTKKLQCRFVQGKSPFLKIAPLKLEEISLNPYIVIYHDILYDVEIQVLKHLAENKVKFYTNNNFIEVFIVILLTTQIL